MDLLLHGGNGFLHEKNSDTLFVIMNCAFEIFLYMGVSKMPIFIYGVSKMHFFLFGGHQYAIF